MEMELLEESFVSDLVSSVVVVLLLVALVIFRGSNGGVDNNSTIDVGNFLLFVIF